MRAVLRLWWERLRSSLWFVPGVLVLAAIGLALLMMRLDLELGRALALPGPDIGAEGARGVLATIAGSIVTVAGVAFSITVVALSLTASQYSSRVLRNFMRDPTSQFVLGLLVGTFAYCLVVLGAIRGGAEGDFVPVLAVFAGVGLAFVAIAGFVWFIHHIATAIQAAHIVANVAAETLAAVDTLFPEPLGEGDGDDDDGAGAPPGDRWQGVPAPGSGYLQRLDEAALLDAAASLEVVVRMERDIGAFVIEGTPLLAVAGAPLDAAGTARLCAVFTIDRFRTTEQDVGYGVRQLVDVALKALSPGINDTTTAIMCVDWLGVVLARMGCRRLPSRARYHQGQLRVLARGPTFAGLTTQAMAQIRQHAAGNSAVLLRQAKALAELRALVATPARRAALLRELELVVRVARDSVPLATDREPIEAQLAACRAD